MRDLWLTFQVLCRQIEASWNVMVMAHAQKPDFIFRRNGRVHLDRWGRQFNRLLAAELWASELVMLDTPCFEVVWRVLATHYICQFLLHFPSRASPCAITFQLDSNCRLATLKQSCTGPYWRHFKASLTSKCFTLTLSPLTSRIWWAPSNASSFNVYYLVTYVWHHWNLSLFIVCTMSQHCINHEWRPVCKHSDSVYEKHALNLNTPQIKSASWGVTDGI
jgi:hypothetical protein